MCVTLVARLIYFQRRPDPSHSHEAQNHESTYPHPYPHPPCSRSSNQDLHPFFRVFVSNHLFQYHLLSIHATMLCSIFNQAPLSLAAHFWSAPPLSRIPRLPRYPVSNLIKPHITEKDSTTLKQAYAKHTLGTCSASVEVGLGHGKWCNRHLKRSPIGLRSGL